MFDMEDVDGSIYCRMHPVQPFFESSDSMLLDSEYGNRSILRAHPRTWSNSDVLDWAYFEVLPFAGVDTQTFNGEVLQGLTGSRLMSMSAADFRKLTEHGDVFYSCLQDKLADSDLNDFCQLYSDYDDIDTALISQFSGPFPDEIDCNTFNAATLPGIGSFISPTHQPPASPPSSSSGSPSTLPTDSLFDLPDYAAVDSSQLFDVIDLRHTPCPERIPEPESGYESGSGNSSPSSYHDADASFEQLRPFPTTIYEDSCIITNNINAFHRPPTSNAFVTTAASALQSAFTGSTTATRRPAGPGVVPSRGVGRPRKQQRLSESSTSSSEGDQGPAAPGPVNKPLPPFFTRRRENRSKTPHLWKFMRALLDDSKYNPEFIRWENRDQGVFRIVPGQSKHIAALWGLKKNNPTMTFDKLSRSLRWCRTYGFLSEVPKNGQYPKKLCFRFADHAMQWTPDPSCLA